MNALCIVLYHTFYTRVTVWCTVAEFGIWGPYFFEEDKVTVTVNSDRYCEMLETFLRPKLNMLHDIDNVWFQQDGATAHTSRRAMGILKEDVPKSFDLIAW